MPRRPRFELPGVPLHVVQRGNDRQRVFVDDEDRRRYLKEARRFADKRGIRVHAYVLMGNHVHMLLSAERAGAVSAFMHDLGATYVLGYNERHARTGTLWEGRFRSCLVDSQSYLWNCHRYIEFNPVRASLCAAPEQYRWSSYAANALGTSDALVHPRPEYFALAPTAAERCRVYRQFVARAAEDEEAWSARLRSAATLGTAVFDAWARGALGRELEPNPPGRPRKKTGTDPIS
jgi:putative transposase